MSSTKNARNSPTKGASGSAELLIATAEKLFAERGIDAVSLREIGREAGQRNNSALLYYFNSKQELILRILRAGVAAVDYERNKFLDRLEAENGLDDVRSVVRAIVLPIVNGRPSTHYIRFIANAQICPDLDLAELTKKEGGRGFDRVYTHLRNCLPDIPEPILRQRFLASVSFMVFALANFEGLEARRGTGKGGFDIIRAIENLIDMLAGGLSAPVSDETRRRM